MPKPGGSLVVTQRTIELASRTIPYTLRRNRRAKRLTLKVDQHGLTAIIPWSLPQDQLDRFIREREAWILAALERSAQRFPPAERPAWSTADGVVLLGRRRVIRFGDGGQGVNLTADTLTLPQRLARDHVQARAYLESWLKEFARRYLAERLASHASAMGVSPRRMTLRSQKTRWGSCSSQGGISLNWGLILAPPAIIDYVLIHELAHLLEMNHSDRFWELVARYDPHYRDHRLWLRQHGSGLLNAMSDFNR